VNRVHWEVVPRGDVAPLECCAVRLTRAGSAAKGRPRVQVTETAGPQSGSLVITALRARARRSFRVKRKAVLRPQQPNVELNRGDAVAEESKAPWASRPPRLCCRSAPE
jgi:hypothetical protein